MYDAILNKAEIDKYELEKQIEILKYENIILSYTLEIPYLKRKKRLLSLLNKLSLNIFKKTLNSKISKIDFVINRYEEIVQKNKI